MAISPNYKNPIPKFFIYCGLTLLGLGMVFGIMGGLQYVIPEFLKESFSFVKTRPLHVSSVVFWIMFSAMGGVLTYLQEHTGKRIFSIVLLKIQFALFTVTIPLILISYCLGIFGGREYWEYPPQLSLPIILAWICFLINFFLSIGSFKKQPVYVWMWLTGICFFLFTFLESYLWIFPYFRNSVVNDMTIQWKSYGSMVGSWNMLIYGCSIFLMDKISGDKNYSHSRLAFALYFTGLFNLLFNWGHHIYTLPTHSFIKQISYGVSMTELVILGGIIFQWKKSETTAQKYYFKHSYRFLAAADVWIFLNLILAILMSVPAINVYTHGTHITVAHAMGTTIGINTMLLLAVSYDTLSDTCQSFDSYKKITTVGFWTANSSLLLFWISLIIAGILKSKWQMSQAQLPFGIMMESLRPFFIIFFMAGCTLMCGIMATIYPLVKNQWVCYQRKNRARKYQKTNHFVIDPSNN